MTKKHMSFRALGHGIHPAFPLRAPLDSGRQRRDGMTMMVFALTAFFVLTTALPALADQAKPVDLSPEQRIELTRIEDYLNAITTAKAAFDQYGANGGKSSGTFYLSRPGRLRFDYTTPQKDIIVADGKFLWFYDAKMKDANHAPLSRTLANFLLRPDVQLTGGAVTVTNYQYDEDIISVTLTQSDDPGQGSLTLQFHDKPLALQGWQVLDAQNRQTRVVLHDPEFGVPLDPALFVFKEPDD